MTASRDAAPLERELAEALARAEEREIPDGKACLKVARAYAKLGSVSEAVTWCSRVADIGLDYRSWDAAARLLAKIDSEHTIPARREARLAVLGSYTTDQLTALLRLAAADRGVRLDVYEAGYDQYQQEILDPGSGMYAHDPDLILIAVHEGELQLPTHASDPEAAVEDEVERWASLWSLASERSGATIIQTNFAKRPENPFGHLATRLPGARSNLIDAVNTRLGQVAGDSVAILDAERLASLHGRIAWFDDRYWHRSKQAVALGALPLLARELSAVITAQLGLSRKCLVLDLDGTLWGGVIGEDGLEGIRLGHGVDGEAFASFQDYLLTLKERGVILAVCSKNDESTAREAFESHPSMRLGMDDFAAFQANWEPKPDNIRRIAESLDIGLDALTFVDDQPAERAAIRRALPEVDVISLPDDPAEYVRAVASYPFFETATFTEEDGRRTETYRARSAAYELKAQAATLEDFLSSLEMRATIGPFDDFHLSRITQLIGKTNQFNLTTRRHNRSAVEDMMSRPDVVHLYLKLEDKFADHGLVGVVIGVPDGEAMEIDTLLMSCRVIGRTAETAMLSVLAERARALGFGSLKGVYRRTDRNGVVEDLYASHGFEKVGASADESTWEFRLDDATLGTEFITTEVM